MSTVAMMVIYLIVGIFLRIGMKILIDRNKEGAPKNVRMIATIIAILWPITIPLILLCALWIFVVYNSGLAAKIEK